MHNRIRVAALLFFVLSASILIAQTPMSITPTSGSAAGGTAVRVTGDFGNSPYGLIFGSIQVPATRLNEHMLVAVTPPHLPGETSVTLFEFDIGIPTNLTFEFFGEVPPEYERVLLPVFTPPVNGAFGSEFHTDLRVGTRRDSLLEIFGLDEDCAPPLVCESFGINRPYLLFAGNEVKPNDVTYSGKPGRFLFLPAEQMKALSANLRVYDVSRADLNFGTEIPVVHMRDFVKDRLVLLGVPTDPRFRNTLRIYGVGPSTVMVTVEGRPPVEVHVQEGTDLFDPAYAVFTDFPIGSAPVSVTIDAEQYTGPISPPLVFPIWAFITLTNNETQVISTISPQP